jgi:hypothetical protein
MIVLEGNMRNLQTYIKIIVILFVSSLNTIRICEDDKFSKNLYCIYIYTYSTIRKLKIVIISFSHKCFELIVNSVSTP